MVPGWAPSLPGRRKQEPSRLTGQVSVSAFKTIMGHSDPFLLSCPEFELHCPRNSKERKKNEELAAWADKHFTGPGGSFTTTDFDLLMATHAKDKSIAVVALLCGGLGRLGQDAGRHGPAVSVVKFPSDNQYVLSVAKQQYRAVGKKTGQCECKACHLLNESKYMWLKRIMVCAVETHGRILVLCVSDALQLKC